MKMNSNEKRAVIREVIDDTEVSATALYEVAERGDADLMSAISALNIAIIHLEDAMKETYRQGAIRWTTRH